MKKIVSLLLSAMLMLTLVPTVKAADLTPPSRKEEVVYGILADDGSVSEIYVVNIFDGGEIVDYGDYTKVTNLTSMEKIEQNGDMITVSSTAKKLYYQGTLTSKELPWSIAIAYTLDGKEISAAELAGKSGALEIAMTVTRNTAVDKSFFDNYALQISFALPTKLCENITAEGATVAEAGGNKQISYTVLPGDGANIKISADVHDFEMDAITINGIKLTLDIDIDYGAFSEQISELADAISKLDGGAGELLDGLKKLSDSMAAYTDGLKAFKEGLEGLGGGIGNLNTGAAALRDGLSALTQQNDAITAGALAVRQSSFDSVNAQLAAMKLGLPTLTPDNYSAVLSGIPDLAQVKTQLDAIVQFTNGVIGYTEGAKQLSGGAAELAKGSAALNASMPQITSSADKLYSGGVQLSAAVKKLRDGMADYKNGTAQLKDGTSDIDATIEAKVNELLDGISGGDGGVVSFVSEKNTETASVQFVLKTDKIEMPETESTETEPVVVLTFWQKLLKLFGLYK